MSTTVLALRMVLAAVFVLAAAGKLMDLEGSRRAVRDFGVPPGAARTVGLLLPLAELLVAVALLIRPTAVWGAVGGLVLLLAFIAGIASALRRGEEPECHCFGQIHSAPAGPLTLARNAALAALAVVVAVEGPGPALHTWIADRTAAEVVAVIMGILALGLGLWALQLWREAKVLRRDFSTAQRIASTAAPGIPIGSPAPGFNLKTVRGETVSLDALRERGRPILLVFVSTTCESCVELLPKLGRWQQTLAERLTIALISTGKPEDNEFFVEEHGVEDVLLQDHLEVIESYRIRGTPSAVIVTLDGKVGSNPAETVFGIEPTLRLALRDGADALVGGPVA